MAHILTFELHNVKFYEVIAANRNMMRDELKSAKLFITLLNKPDLTHSCEEKKKKILIHTVTFYIDQMNNDQIFFL